MRVALLTSANGWRGSGASFVKLARGLSERGHSAHLVTAAPRLTARFQAEGLAVTELPGRNTGPREVWSLWRALHRLDAQAVVVDTPRDVRLAAYATLTHRAPIVYRYNLNYRRPRGHLADRLYLRRIAGCVFQSLYIRDQAYAQIPRTRSIPGYLVPNGYDTERFAPRPEAARTFRARWDLPSHTLIVLTSAKLVANKGHEVAIAALGQARRAGVNLLYLVCGDGPRDAELRRAATEAGVPTRFTGLLAPEDMVAALNTADLVVHPSPQEIFPNAVGEAMSCARPVVAADAGGTGELLGRGGSTGVLVSSGDVGAMARAIIALLNDAPLRTTLGNAARQRIRTEFPLRRMIDGYETALAAMVQPGG